MACTAGSCLVLLCFAVVLVPESAAGRVGTGSMRSVHATSRRELKETDKFFTEVVQSVASVIAAPGPANEKVGQAVQAVLGAVKDAGQQASESGDRAGASAAAAVTAAATAVTNVVTAVQAPAPPGDKAVQTVLGMAAGVGQVTTAALDAADPRPPGNPEPKSDTQKASAVFKKFTNAVTSTRACLQCHRQCTNRGGTALGPRFCTHPGQVVDKCSAAQCILPAAGLDDPAAVVIATRTAAAG